MMLPFVIQSLSRVQLFAAPWTAPRQASRSLTISWSLPKFESIESVALSILLEQWLQIKAQCDARTREEAQWKAEASMA